MVSESYPIGPGNNKYILRVISENGTDEVVIKGKKEISEKPIEQELIDEVFGKIVERINDPETDRYIVTLPDVDSGGGTGNSILNVLITRGNEETMVGMFLERENDKSAGTVAGKTIRYKGDLNDDSLKELYEGLQKLIKDYSKVLAARSDLRQTVRDFIRLQNLKRNSNNN